MDDRWPHERRHFGPLAPVLARVAMGTPSPPSWTLFISTLVAACGGSESTTGSAPDGDTEAPPDRTVASIEFLTDSVRPMGMLGVTFQVRARGLNAAGEIILQSFQQVVWSTDTPEIVEVTSEGEVTSLSEGEGRVIARLGGLEASIRVPVREVARLAWQRRLEGYVGGQRAPTIAPDGTVYASSQAHFWALEPSGAIRWSKAIPHGYSGPAIGPEGILYLVSAKGAGMPGDVELSAAEPDGTKLWGLPRPQSVRFPVLGADGTLYAMQRDGDDAILLAVSASQGELLWEYRAAPPTADPPVFSAPALGSDDVVYFSTAEGTVWAVTAGGEPLWSTRPGGEFSRSEPVVAADGTVYVGSLDDHLYALNPADGSVRWSLDLAYDIHASPALGADGTIYQTAGPLVYAISPGGDVLWSWTAMEGLFPAARSPVVGGNGMVYVGAVRGLVAIGPDGVLRWDFNTEYAVDAAPAIGVDGTVYIAAEDSVLHAIRELEGGNGGFDASPWPVWRGNRQNTGRAGP